MDTGNVQSIKNSSVCTLVKKLLYISHIWFCLKVVLQNSIEKEIKNQNNLYLIKTLNLI